MNNIGDLESSGEQRGAGTVNAGPAWRHASESVAPLRRHERESVAPLVLVAEDDDELRHLLVRKLRRRGCAVAEARTGMELAQLVVERGIEHGTPASAELLITDVRMPGLTGIEVLGLLRDLDWVMPVILMTGFGDAEVHAEASRLGARLFDKPLDLDELVDAACAALGLGSD